MMNNGFKISQYACAVLLITSSIALVRYVGAFKGYAHRECESCIRTHEHRHDTDITSSPYDIPMVSS